MKGTIPKPAKSATVVRKPVDAKPADAKAPAPATVIRKPVDAKALVDTKAPVDTKPAPTPTKPKPKEPDLALARKRVSVRLLDGTHLAGRVDWVSTYTVVLNTGDQRHVIYKHAIAWMTEIDETEG